jgi:hypothetical protein
MEVRSLTASFILLAAMPVCLAASPSYRKDIAPILAERCVVCHSERSQMGGVRLDTIAAIRQTPQLLEVIHGEKPRMPKAGKPLNEKQVELIRIWVQAGYPNDGALEPEVWWSQRPLRKFNPPAAGHPIDAFIQAKLKESGLRPSPRADARTLARRLTYNLHGLPPTKEQLSKPYADLVEELLASPRYGERWARHWLDVVHFGETHGYEKDKPRFHAWRYRDWVIQAFNSDLPYREFVRLQIAGDAIRPYDRDAVIATGMLAAGPWDYVGHQELVEGTMDKELTRVLDRDDMVMTVMSAFQSQTVHCARCHDHKFDPISQADHYSMQAVFAGVDRTNRPIDQDPSLAKKRAELWERKRQVLLQLRPYEDKMREASTPELDRLEMSIKDAALLLAHLGQPKTPKESAEKELLTAQRKADTEARAKLLDEYMGPPALQEMAALRGRLVEIDQALAMLPEPEFVYAPASVFDRVMTFQPALSPRPVHVLGRGSVSEPLALAEPGAIGIRFGNLDDPARRLALADWIASDGNAFTWRSIVNRVWHYHFGAGLVDTPNDFGRMGGQPSHPELLDWLAVWFRDEAKGSLKELHRLILSSATYQQSSQDRPEALDIDGNNRLLWRANRQRLDAESIRDSFVWLSGKMDFTMGGPSVQQFWFKDDHAPTYDYARYDPQDPGLYRRSIYRFLVRSVPDPFMERLDCPDASLITPKRNETITAVQALTLLNNPFVLRMAAEFAARLPEQKPIAEAFRLALGREPGVEEEAALEDYKEKYGLASALRLLLNMNEFAFTD